MDQCSLIGLLGQASVSEAGRIFREYLRGGVRMMMAEVMAAEVAGLCGQKYHPTEEATCRRAGSTSGYVVWEGNREDVKRPLPALCIRFPKQKNPLTFEWKGEEVQIRCMLMGEINEGRGLSILIDVGEVMGSEGIPIYTYRNFRRQEGLTVEEAIKELGSNELAELGVQIPDTLINDCVRLCCSLCLLEHDPSVIEPDVLSKDRARFEQTGDEKYVAKAHRRGKVGWNVGRRIEVIPHYRRPHMALVWTGRGRAVPRVVPRRGSVVHREVVEKVPSGFDAS